MEEITVCLERHEQRIIALQNAVDELRVVQGEIRSINETLIKLANELKHTNEHLLRNEGRIESMEQLPTKRRQQIFSALISAAAGGIVTLLLSSILK